MVPSAPLLAALGYLARSLHSSPQLEALSVAFTHDGAALACSDRGHARALSRFLLAARDALSARCGLRCACQRRPGCVAL